MKFAFLLVLRDSGERTRRNGERLWECRCDCGQTTQVATYKLHSGATQSCGCHRRANMRAISTTHGLTDHPLYHVWAAMLRRCRNPNNLDYARYGGRGIRVCTRWQGPRGFPNFLADMGERPDGPERLTLERNNNEGDYEPSNCRWATYKEQAANRRPRVPANHIP